MTHSTRKTLAKVRRSYTGETTRAAKAGVGREHLGLDACSPAQLELRALLARLLLNSGAASALSSRNGVSTLTCYTMILSPRYDDLVIITRAELNVMAWLVPRPETKFFDEVPGLRFEAVSNHTRGLRLRHLPTGARMVVTPNINGRFGQADGGDHDYIRAADIDVPLSASEKTLLSELPEPTADARVLLAGLVTRFSAIDARRQWAIGQWFEDPLNRPDQPRGSLTRATSRQLAGDGDAWTLRWEEHPRVEDVARALTDDVAGLRGAQAERTSRGYTVTFGDASLALARL
ncbi:conserved hypothetical protein [Catenulispora acidiphila DSM 44928]|uniref:Uncharacterized protein n=1 Tax=Catenulispora acidiphila (strain DSM 44928 / JCM 14897 / NBRC 102108 / NRRL B-24433 / ID139908) TaxID=479433 RepID=C7Q5I5_CATAD|nr:hypothetical protein [Catenulispora acidiphila]ACU77796.1 conserved hypothetical protein [Catenulispora acidiphila DSM 44928]